MAARKRLCGAMGCTVLLSTLALAACSGSGPQVSGEGRARCQRRAELEDIQPLRPLVYQHCLTEIEAKLAEERREQRQRLQEHARQLERALGQCRQKRSELQASLKTLRQAESDLARLRSSGRPPLPPPPPRPDEVELQRYTRTDAELDRQRFEDSLMGWQKLLAQRQLQRQRHQSALDDAQLRLDQAALRLHKLQPDLLAKGIELDPVVARRVLECDPQVLAASLPDAPPLIRAPLVPTSRKRPIRADARTPPTATAIPPPHSSPGGANPGVSAR